MKDLIITLKFRAFAISSVTIWVVRLFLLTWWIISFNEATSQPTLIGCLYRGYIISPFGSVIGFVRAFIDVVIGGAIFAWLYNLLARKGPAKQVEAMSDTS